VNLWPSGLGDGRSWDAAGSSWDLIAGGMAPAGSAHDSMEPAIFFIQSETPSRPFRAHEGSHGFLGTLPSLMFRATPCKQSSALFSNSVGGSYSQTVRCRRFHSRCRVTHFVHRPRRYHCPPLREGEHGSKGSGSVTYYRPLHWEEAHGPVAHGAAVVAPPPRRAHPHH
jgi:hypothetical protein